MRVVYSLTATGRKLAAIIAQIRDLDEEHAYRTRTNATGSKIARPGNSNGFRKHLQPLARLRTTQPKAATIRETVFATVHFAAVLGAQ